MDSSKQKLLTFILLSLLVSVSSAFSAAQESILFDSQTAAINLAGDFSKATLPVITEKHDIAFWGTLVHVSADNLGAKTFGAEFEINYRPDCKNILHAGYAFTRVKQASDKQLMNHKLNVLFSQQYNNSWHSGFKYYYISEMQYLGGQNDPQVSLQGIDLSVGKLIQLTNTNPSLEFLLAFNRNTDFYQLVTADNLIYFEVGYRAG